MGVCGDGWGLSAGGARCRLASGWAGGLGGDSFRGSSRLSCRRKVMKRLEVFVWNRIIRAQMDDVVGVLKQLLRSYGSLGVGVTHRIYGHQIDANMRRIDFE